MTESIKEGLIISCVGLVTVLIFVMWVPVMIFEALFKEDKHSIWFFTGRCIDCGGKFAPVKGDYSLRRACQTCGGSE